MLVCPDENDVEENGANDEHSHSNPAPPIQICNKNSRVQAEFADVIVFKDLIALASRRRHAEAWCLTS